MAGLQHAYDDMTPPEEPPPFDCEMCGVSLDGCHRSDEGLCIWCWRALQRGICHCREHANAHAAGHEDCEYPAPDDVWPDNGLNAYWELRRALDEAGEPLQEMQPLTTTLGKPAKGEYK